MNNQLLIIIFWILALSCKAPVSSLHQDKVSVISAEKTDWFGGRPGVRGTMYTIKLKLKNNKDLITVKSLRAEGNTVSPTQNISGNIITVKGNITITPKPDNFEDMPSGATFKSPKASTKINSKDNWIEFVTKNSKKAYKIAIPEFVSVEPEGDLIPQRQ
ncbi:hypothetical protein SAMN05880574_10326 [Chryseobacterium sp. RU37D]|uniref:hypothetical protein n=1 Tax=Chryseobacterium sp. RU37D TaxID=1907397 RepID=UPI000955E4E4|nr:hypothetical protein [Chryseobacterium sp. RU37D]SIP96340.1 hypothetical protein SAMN05880574_10326 [Chryseobacterium sp. RU37D]